MQSLKSSYPNKEKKFEFLKDQVQNSILISSQKYTSCTLLEAAKLHSHFPDAYKYFRDGDLLTLPHPRTLSHLKRILTSNESSEEEENQK